MEKTQETAGNNIQKNQGQKLHQVIVFKLGQEEYGLMIDQIKEVVLTPPISKVPLTQGYIKGVANIRGNVMAILDLEEKFGLSRPDGPANDNANYCLVVESKKHNMAVLVREVPNTLSVADSDIDASPSIISEFAGEKNYIQGIIKLEKRLVILIDIFKVISKEELAALKN